MRYAPSVNHIFATEATAAGAPTRLCHPHGAWAHPVSSDGNGPDEACVVNPVLYVDPVAIATIRELQVQRVATMKMQHRINNQCGALVRRAIGWSMEMPDAQKKAINATAADIVKLIQGGKPIPPEHELVAGSLGVFILAARESRRHFDILRRNVEAEMDRLAKSLPAYAWVEPIPGLGSLGLAIIVGEAGDLSNYANPAKLWKRLGLASMPDGRCQRKVLDAEQAKLQGYNPRRRSAIWTIAESMLRKQNVYRDIYVARRLYEIEKHPEFDKGADPKTGKPRVSMHCHRRAKRYAEKRMIRDLWRAWRGQRGEPNESIVS